MAVLLDGTEFMHGAENYRWDYRLRMSSVKTIGGKVIQLFGVTMGDMSVTVQFASPQEQQEWFVKIKSIMDNQIPVMGQRAATPVRFVWNEQNIDCMVFVKDVTQEGESVMISATNESFAPKWNISLFVEEDNTGIRQVAQDSAKAAYIRRLAAGLGWVQSEWNGPEENAEFEQAVETNTVLTYLARQREQYINEQYQPQPTPEEGG